MQPSLLPLLWHPMLCLLPSLLFHFNSFRSFRLCRFRPLCAFLRSFCCFIIMFLFLCFFIHSCSWFFVPSFCHSFVLYVFQYFFICSFLPSFLPCLHYCFISFARCFFLCSLISFFRSFFSDLFQLISFFCYVSRSFFLFCVPSFSLSFFGSFLPRLGARIFRLL